MFFSLLKLMMFEMNRYKIKIKEKKKLEQMRCCQILKIILKHVILCVFTLNIVFVCGLFSSLWSNIRDILFRNFFFLYFLIFFLSFFILCMTLHLEAIKSHVDFFSSIFFFLSGV